MDERADEITPYQAIFENAAVGIGQLDSITGEILRANQRYCEILDTTQQELIGKTWMDLTHPDDLETDVEQMNRLLTGEIRSFSLEKRLRHRNGTYRWINLSVSAMWQPGDAPTTHIAIVDDITEQKRNQEELQFTKFSVDSCSVSVFWIRKDASFFYVNDQTTREFGYPRETLLTMNVHDIDPSYPPEVWPQYWASMQQQRRLNFETQIQHLDGRMIPVEIVTSLMEYQGEEFVFAFVNNISERKQVAEELRQNEERLRMFVDQVPAVLWTTNCDLQFTLSAGGGLADLGLEPDQVVGTKVSDFLQSDDPNYMPYAQHLRALSGESCGYENEVLDRVFHAHMEPLTDSQGQIIGTIGVALDVTEQKETVRRLTESEERYRRLINNAPFCIHEIELNGTISSMNKTGLEMLGLSNESEVIGVKYLSAVCDEDRQRVSDLLEQAYEGETSFFEFKTSANRHFRSCFVPLLDDVGIIQRITGITEDIHEKKLTEANLRKREQQMKVMADSLPVLIAYVDMDERYVYLNATCKSWWHRGLSSLPPHAHGQTIAETVTEEHYHELVPYIRRVQEGETVDFETTVDTPSGQRHWHVTYAPHVSDAGSLVGFYMLVVDATDRVQAERQFRRSREAMDLVVEGTSRVTGRDYCASLVRHLAQATGFRHVAIASVERNKPKTASAVAVCSDGEMADHFEYDLEGTPCEQVISQGQCLYASDVQKTFPTDDVLRALDGQSYLGAPLINSSGDTIGVLFAIDRKPMDDHHFQQQILQLFADRAAAELERMSVEQALRASEELYRNVVELSPGVIIVHVEGRIVFANPAATRLFGCELQSMMGRSIIDLFVPADRERVANRIRRITDHGETVEPNEMRLLRDDGQIADIEAIGTPIQFGGKSAVLAMAFDITERKRFENALQITQHSVDNSHTAIFWITPKGEFAYVNQAACDLVGYTEPDLLELNAADLGVGYNDSFWQQVKNRQSVTYQTKARRGDDTEVPVLLSASYFEFNGQEYVLAFLTNISDQVRAETALRENEERFRLAFDQQFQFMAILDADGRVVEINDLPLRMQNASRDDYIGKYFWDAPAWEKLPEWRETIRQRVLDAPKSDEPLLTEDTYMRGDGSLGVAMAAYSVIRKQTGELRFILVQATDITERRNAEIKLRDGEKRFRAIFNSTFQFIGLLTIDGRLLEANETALQFGNVEPEDVLGRPFWETFWWCDDPPRMQRLQDAIKAAADGQFVRYTEEVRGANSVETIDFSIKPVLDDDGRVTLLVPEGRVITAQKRAEDARRKNEELLEVTNRLASVGGWELDLETRVLSWSAQTCRIHEVSPDYRPDLDTAVNFYAPEARPVISDAVDAAVKTGACWDLELPLITAKGNRRWVRAQGVAERIDGKVVRLHGALHDITELRDAEEESRKHRDLLAHVTRLSTMGEMVAGIAHEVKQPLYAITNFATASSVTLDNLENNVIDASTIGELAEWNQGVRQASKRASEIIKRLREFSQRRESTRDRLDIAQVVGESIELVAFEARRFEVQVETLFEEDLPPVYADRVQVEQVMVNLLHNAYEALSDQDVARRVTVRIRRGDGVVELEIEDNGPGIPVDQHGKLFEAFYTTKTSGMGMGLAISQTIIEDHGGRLWGSVNDEGGATFHVTLPYRREATMHT